MSEELEAARRCYEAAKRGMESHTEALNAAKELCRNRYAEFCALKWGLTIGGKVTRKGATYVVSSIDRFYSLTSKPWISGRKVKKNGEPSEYPNHLYGDWEVLADA